MSDCKAREAREQLNHIPARGSSTALWCSCHGAWVGNGLVDNLDLVARWQEGVEPQDEAVVTLEQLRHTLDHARGVDTGAQAVSDISPPPTH